MRLKFLLLLFLVVALISDVSAAKDRKRNRNKGRNNEESVVQDDDDGSRTSGGGFSLTEERRKETKDRVMTLVEREEERKKDKEDKEESSEEKDKKEEKVVEKHGMNLTEPDVPVRRFRRTHHDLSRVQEINDGELKSYRHRAHHRRRRQEHTLKKATEINDGEQQPVENKPSQDHKCGPDCKHPSRKRRAEIARHEVRLRHRRQEHTLKKTAEINDGVQTAVDAKPSQDHQCGPNCKHPARLRRAKAKGGKDVGHRAASHPHKKNAARGSGKRRNQQNVKHETGGRKPRHLKTIPEVSEENTEATEGLKDLQSPEGKAFTYSRKYIRVHGKRPPALPEDEPVAQAKEVPSTIRAQRKRVSRTISSAFPEYKDSNEPSEKDRTLVTADNAEIFDF